MGRAEARVRTPALGRAEVSEGQAEAGVEAPLARAEGSEGQAEAGAGPPWAGHAGLAFPPDGTVANAESNNRALSLLEERVPGWRGKEPAGLAQLVAESAELLGTPKGQAPSHRSRTHGAPRAKSETTAPHRNRNHRGKINK